MSQLEKYIFKRMDEAAESKEQELRNTEPIGEYLTYIFATYFSHRNNSESLELGDGKSNEELRDVISRLETESLDKVKQFFRLYESAGYTVMFNHLNNEYLLTITKGKFIDTFQCRSYIELCCLLEANERLSETVINPKRSDII